VAARAGSRAGFLLVPALSELQQNGVTGRPCDLTRINGGALGFPTLRSIRRIDHDRHRLEPAIVFFADLQVPEATQASLGSR